MSVRFEGEVERVTVSTAVMITANVDDSTSSIASAVYTIDGTCPFASCVMSATDGSFNQKHEAVAAVVSFAASAVYWICVRGADAAGNQAEANCVFLPVYDPEAGFVTGGGWVTSPAGAYKPNSSVTGRGDFGFVSKYKLGASAPTGETEFQFKVAGLSFHNDAYEWLVVGGARAQYRGVGKVNGTGYSGFLLTAIDGQTSGGGGVDKFRIKIWDKVMATRSFTTIKCRPPVALIPVTAAPRVQRSLGEV